MKQGKIIEIRGVVVDVQFEKGNVPVVYEALDVTLDKNTNLVLEVEALLGEGKVRTVAMGSTQGLKRGLEVSARGEGITTPVGKETLGRLFNVFG